MVDVMTQASNLKLTAPELHGVSPALFYMRILKEVVLQGYRREAVKTDVGEKMLAALQKTESRTTIAFMLQPSHFFTKCMTSI